MPQGHLTTEVLLREYVQQVRHRRLVISRDADVASPGGPSGMWLPSDGVDLVWVHPSATGVQADQIIGHEMGHMVNGDEPEQLDLRDLVKLLASTCKHTSTDLWASATCRTNFDETRERHAEEFAYFTSQWRRAKPPTTKLLANMREALDTKGSW
ncbi:hypothetical protein ACWGQT_00520 [Streptomyces yangpuensis]